MSTYDFDEAVEHFHVAQGEFLKGHPEAVKELFSHRDDVSLANPYGPPVRGWQQVAQTIERASSLRRDGELVGIETIAKYVTADLGYVVQIERAKAKIGARQDITRRRCGRRTSFAVKMVSGRWCIATPSRLPPLNQQNRSSSSRSLVA